MIARRTPITTLALSTSLALVAGLLGLAAQQLPEGEGRQVIVARCSNCHELDRVAKTRRDREGWNALLEKMLENGAALDDKERALALDYLSRHLAPAPAADSEADRTARRYVTGICSSCHMEELITSTRATKDEWLAIVQNMNGRGAGLSEADVELLAEYLARRYPK
jgi:cytochrome c553